MVVEHKLEHMVSSGWSTEHKQEQVVSLRR